MANLRKQIDMKESTGRYEGTPCKKCGCTTRYTATGVCVFCRAAWKKNKRATDPEWAERERLRNRKWWSENGAERNLRRQGLRQEADAAYFRERYATDEDYKERARSRHRKRRALKKGTRTERYTRDQAYAQTGGRCTRCGRIVQRDTNWHIDHRVPLAIGGPDVLTNVGPCHPKCNARGHTTIAKTQESLFAVQV